MPDGTGPFVVSGHMWIFGYGSLVWRPAFPHDERRPAYVRGWTRRFWQGSTDHRGVPGAPGRVATLLREEGACCWGTAYRVSEEHADSVLERLDHREKGGYERHVTTVYDGHTDEPLADALLYVATDRNDNWLGPAPTEAIAEQIRRSVGPSGPNVEYVLELARALRAMGAHDAHVFALAAHLE